MSKHDDVEIPSMMLDQDEVNERRASSDSIKKRSTPAIASKGKAEEAMLEIDEVDKKPRLTWIYLLLFVSFSVVLVLGYMGWSQNQQLKSELLGQIQNLDSQLVAVDASASEQGSTIKEVLTKHDSEIRKLWGVAYDVNRKAIKTNSDDIASLVKEQSSFKQSVLESFAKQNNLYDSLAAKQKTLVDTVSKITEKDLVALRDQQESMKKSLLKIEGDSTLTASKVESQKSQIETLLKSLAAVEKTSVENVARMKEADKTLRAVADRVSALESKIRNQLGDIKPGDFQIQLKDHQEAIDSIDAYRVQVNNKLNRLEENVNKLLLQNQTK